LLQLPAIHIALHGIT